MTAGVRLTPRARQDLLSIGRYTFKRWGRAQRDRYLAALDQRFRWLAENPLRGKARPEIGSGLYSFAEGSHLIFYIVRGADIEVVGVLHQAMDILTHLAKRRP